MKKIVVLPDVHLDHRIEQTKSYRLVKRYVKETKPDQIVLLGDFMDMACISRFAESKPGSHWAAEKKYDLVRDIEYARSELDLLQESTRKIVYLEGNHEKRMLDYGQKYPELLDFADFRRLLGLETRKIEWIPETKQPYVSSGMAYIHGWYFNKYSSAKTVEEYCGDIIYGHTHTIQSFTKRVKSTGRDCTAYNIGCLCLQDQSYQRGMPNRHVNGFAVVYSDGKTSTTFPIRITDDQFFFESTRWKA